MAEEIQDGSLSWIARIDTSEIAKDVKTIGELFNAIGEDVDLSDIDKIMKEQADRDIQDRKNVMQQVAKINDTIAAQTVQSTTKVFDSTKQQANNLKSYFENISNPENNGIPALLNADVINEAKEAYASADPVTKKFIEDLIQYQDTLTGLNAKQSQLKDALTAGAISWKEYYASFTENVKAINQTQVNFQNTSIPFANKGNVQPVSNEAITQAKAAYESADVATRKYLDDSVALEFQLSNLKIEQANLNQTFKDGSVSQETYLNQSTQLKAAIEGVTGQLNSVKEAHKAYLQSLNDEGNTTEKNISILTEYRQLRNKIASDQVKGIIDEADVQRATELEHAIRNTNSELNLASSNTAALDALGEGVQGLVGGFTALSGAVGIFAGNSEIANQVTQYSINFLTLLNGVQQLGQTFASEGKLNNYINGLLRKNTAIKDATVAQQASNAATIEGSAIEETNTAITEANKAAKLSQAAATTTAAESEKGLNIAMEANPAGVLILSLTALIAAYYALTNRSSEVKSAQELLADAQKNVANNFAESESKILPYVEALKNANISENDRLNIYNKLAEIDPKITEGINARSISYQQLAANVDKYLDSLRLQYSFEATGKAITGSLSQENTIKKQLDDAQKESDRLNKLLKQNGLSYQEDGTSIASLITFAKLNVQKFTEELNQQQAVTKGLVTDSANLEIQLSNLTAAQKGTVDAIDKQIASLRQQQTAVSDTSAKWKEYQKQIDALQKQRDSITGPSQKELKAEQSLEEKINSILSQRQSVLEKLAGLQRESQQSGLLQNDSEIDKIKEKYDQAFQSIDDYNKKIDDFNKLHKTNLSGIGASDVDKLKSAEAIEIANTQYKQDSANYIQSLENKKKAFDDLQRIQATGNEDLVNQALQTYKDQLQGFTSYLDFLKAQAASIVVKMTFGGSNIGDIENLQALNKKIQEEQNVTNEQNAAHQIQIFQDAYTASQTYDAKRKQIDVEYNQYAAALSRTYSGKELEDRLKVLEQSKEDAIDQAKDEAFQKTQIYQELNEQIVELTKKQIESQIEGIKELLHNPNISNDFKSQLQNQLSNLTSTINLTPNARYVSDLKKQLADVNDQLAHGDNISKQTGEELLKQKQTLEQEIKDATSLASKFQKASDVLINISGDISGLGSAIQPFNAGLADTLNTLGSIVNVAGDAAGAFADFASGNIVGGIEKTIQTITGIFNIFGAAKKSKQEADAQLQQYEDSLVVSSIEYNDLLRDRARNQQDVNKLTAQELQIRQQMLDVQKQQAQQDYNTLLAQIQAQGQQVTGEHETKYGGFLGIGRKTKTVQDLAGLSNTDYNQLEQLFTEGKLDEKTAAWFQELQKVHDELDSIGQSAQDTADALNQALTGTTADSITDSIVQGFASGKTAASDFADDFQSLMRNAVLQSLKYSALQKPLNDFYQQFAADAASDNVLTQDEITQLQDQYNSIIDNASKQFQQLKDITNVDFSTNSSDNANTLKGSSSNLTENTGELLAGQIGALRLTALEAKNINQELLNNSIQNLQYLNEIASNTSHLIEMDTRLNSIDNRLRDMQTSGIKIK